MNRQRQTDRQTDMLTPECSYGKYMQKTLNIHDLNCRQNKIISY